MSGDEEKVLSQEDESDWFPEGIGEDEPDPGEPPAQPEAPVAPAEASAPTDQPPQVPTSDGSVTAPAATPAADPAAPTPITTTEVPHVFRADGREIPIPGATKASDGSIRIPPEAVPHLQNHLADRRVWQERERQLRHEVAAAQASKGEREQKADVLLAEFAKLSQMDPQGRWDWLSTFEQQLPLLEERAKAKAAQEELERYRTQAQPVLESQQWEAQAPLYQEGIQARVEQWAAGEFVGLDMVQTMEALQPWLKDLIVKAPMDVPEEGIRKGDAAIDLQKLYRLVSTQHRAQQAVTQARAQAQKDQETKLAQAQAAQLNAKAAAPVKAPPVVSGTRSRSKPVHMPARDEGGRFTADEKSWDDEFDELDLRD